MQSTVFDHDCFFAVQTMYVAEWTPDAGWKGEMRPYGPLQLEPAAQACPTHKLATFSIILHQAPPIYDLMCVLNACL